MSVCSFALSGAGITVCFDTLTRAPVGIYHEECDERFKGAFVYPKHPYIDSAPIDAIGRQIIQVSLLDQLGEHHTANVFERPPQYKTNNCRYTKNCKNWKRCPYLHPDKETVERLEDTRGRVIEGVFKRTVSGQIVEVFKRVG